MLLYLLIVIISNLMDFMRQDCQEVLMRAGVTQGRNYPPLMLFIAYRPVKKLPLNGECDPSSILVTSKVALSVIMISPVMVLSPSKLFI